MSGELDSRNDSQSTKFKRGPRIFVMLSFRELCDSKLYGLHAFDNMAIIHVLLENDYKTFSYNLPHDINYAYFLYYQMPI